MLNSIEIFRSGAHISAAGDSVSILNADLAAAVDAYDPAASEAPLVVGHPEANAPAYGWVKKLTTDGNALIAEVDQLDPEFAEIVKAGRYKKISASFYSPTSPHNPKPGAWYLRHVGFLGAQPPAVKGLKPVSFSAADNDGVMSFSTENKGNKKMTEEEIKAKAAALALEAAALAKEKADFSEAQAKAGAEADKKRAAEFAEKEAALAAREKKILVAEHASFAEGLIKAGKLLPKDKEAVVSIMADIPRDCVVNFSEGKKKPMLDSFKEFLESQPVRVDFKEHSPAPAGGDANDYKKIGADIAAYIPKGK